MIIDNKYRRLEGLLITWRVGGIINIKYRRLERLLITNMED